MSEGTPKSPQQLDFSKPEVRERFEKLDEKIQEQIIGEAYTEADQMEYLVRSNTVADYAEAAEYVAASNEYAEVENRVKEVEKKKIDDLTRKLKDTEETIRFYENGAISNVEDFGSEGEALAERIDSIVYLPHHLKERLEFLEKEGQSELAEQYGNQCLKSMEGEIERYEKKGRGNPCKRCFINDRYYDLADVLTINNPETIVDKSRRLLTMLAKMQNWYSDEEYEGEGSGDAGVAFVTDYILKFVNYQWPSMSAEKQKEFIEMTLNEMKPVLDTGRNSRYDDRKDYKDHFDKSRNARTEIAHLIVSLKSDPEYRVSVLKEWSEKFSNELIPIDALSVIMGSDKVDEEQKRAFVDEIWKRFNAQSTRAYEKERNMRPYVDYIMQALLSVAEAKVEIPNFEKIIETLVQKTKQINQRGFGNYKSGMLADIEIGEEKIKSLLEQSSENIEPGFSMKEAEYARGTKLYLDGKFLGIAENAQFSNQPSNGEIVAWVSRELIDYDRVVKGSQWRHNVFVWKKGWDSPKRIFEDHAYESERQFNVLPPIVTPDGKIEVEVDSRGKTEKRTLNVE